MEWRRLVRFPGFEISEYGDCRKACGRRIRGTIDADGYIRYSITRADGARTPVPAHKLVAEAFIGPAPTPQHEIAHGNGSRIFCHYSNLRWATSAENHADRVDHITDAAGERNGRHIVTEGDVKEIRRRRRSGIPVSDLAREFGISTGQAYRISSGKAWAHIPMENYKDSEWPL